MSLGTHKSLRIYSHPRSGSNYFAQLIDLNITKTGDYNNIYGGHTLPNAKFFENTEEIILYLKRDFASVVKSLYKMKEPFGLEVTNFESFLKSHYAEIYNGNLFALVKVKTENREISEKRVSKHFAGIKMIPEEYHKHHIESWEQYAGKSNFIIIDYQDLIEDYSAVLNSICDKFSIPKKEKWRNVEEQMGYIPYTRGIERYKMNVINYLIITPMQVFIGLIKRILWRKWK